VTAAGESRGLMGGGLASLLLHVLAALLIPALAWAPSSLPPIETISFVHVARIEIQPRRQPVPRPQAVAPRYRRAPVISLATHVVLPHAALHRTVVPRRAVVRRESGAPVVAANLRAGAPVGAGSAAPQVSTTPPPREVASVGTHRVGGYLPFGAEQPDPVLDPGVLKQLDTLGVHVTLLVTVGDDGKTKRVTFVPPIDPQLEAHIESLLADATWDPAVCGGGVACEAQTTIKL